MLKNKKGVSIMETLIVVFIITIGILSVISVVTSILKRVNTINQKMIALNLAKEGIEYVYQIRNTNVLLYTGAEAKWLNLNPQDSDSDWMGNSNYIIITGDNSEKTYHYMSGINAGMLDLGEYGNTRNSGANQSYKMCLNGTGNDRKTCPGTTDNLNKYGRFFRTIEGKGVYNKEGVAGTYKDCNNPNSDPWCTSNAAKEYRFCTRVEYYELGGDVKEVEICSLMTNFFESS